MPYLVGGWHNQLRATRDEPRSVIGKTQLAPAWHKIATASSFARSPWIKSLKLKRPDFLTPFQSLFDKVPEGREVYRKHRTF